MIIIGASNESSTSTRSAAWVTRGSTTSLSCSAKPLRLIKTLLYGGGLVTAVTVRRMGRGQLVPGTRNRREQIQDVTMAAAPSRLFMSATKLLLGSTPNSQRSMSSGL